MNPVLVPVDIQQGSLPKGGMEIVSRVVVYTVTSSLLTHCSW